MNDKIYIKIELELHSITCPGVWLCPNGCAQIIIRTLGYCFKSEPLEPKFPLLCHNLYKIEGYYKNVRCMYELKELLNKEPFEITLWQNSRRLAYYNGKLNDILYLSMSKLTTCNNNEIIQILMTPSKCFPGIISPKTELFVCFMIQDDEFGNAKEMKCNSNIIIPYPCKTESFKNQHSHDNVHVFKRQKPVCHFKRNSCSDSYPFVKSCHDFQKRIRLLCDKCTQIDKSTLNDDNDDDTLNTSKYQDRKSSRFSRSRCSSNSNSPRKLDVSRKRENLDLFQSDTIKNNEHHNYSSNISNMKLLLEDHDKHKDNCYICKTYYDIFHFNNIRCRCYLHSK